MSLYERSDLFMDNEQRESFLSGIPEQHREFLSEIFSTITQETSLNLGIFESNATRVDGLLVLYDRICVGGTDDKNLTDILRACVVLIHASLEEFLRVIGGTFLPFVEPKKLEELFKSSKAVEHRYTVQELYKSVDMSIVDFLKAELAKHLSQASWSSASQIASYLAYFDYPICNKLSAFFPILDEMISRRHQIVHRADMLQNENSPTVINKEMVQKWLNGTREFISLLSKGFAVDKVMSNPENLGEVAKKFGLNIEVPKGSPWEKKALWKKNINP